MVNANGQTALTKSPRLIVQITVDQRKGDMPPSVYDRFGKVGSGIFTKMTSFMKMHITAMPITSTYYCDAYPGWVDALNRNGLSQAYAGTNRDLMHDKSTYKNGDFDDMPWEIKLPGFGITFPHPFGASESKPFITLLTPSPAGDGVTLKFVRERMVQEGLGQDDITDYLPIRFSSTDYAGHVFGPSSLESEDNLLCLGIRLLEPIAFICNLL